MPSGGTVDSLSIQINSSASKATKALDKLASSLEKIAGLSADSGLSTFIEQLNNATDSASGLSEQLNKLKGFSGDIKVTANNTSHLTGAFGSLWKMLKRVAVATGAIQLFKKGYGLSTDFFETANYFKVVMGQYTEDAYKYGQAVGEALGLDESQWMQNQATFMSLATTFGNTSDSAYLMSKNLTQLVYDLSSLKNVNADVAMQKLRSAFAGEIEPLRDWGVDLSKANLQLVALNNNIDKSFDSMTQAEKSQLRYVTIMNQLEYAMGDLSNTLTSPGNQLRLLEMAALKAARAFGNIFIPILNKVIPVVIAMANAIRMLFERIAALFGFEYPEMKNWDKYSDSIGGVADSLDDATGSAKALKKQLAGFDEINNLTTNQGSGSGNVAAGGFAGLDLPTYESLGKSFLGDALDQKIANITDKLTKFGEVIKGLLPIIVAIGTALLIWNGYFDALNLVGKISSKFQAFWDVLKANYILAIVALIAALVAALIYLYNTNEDVRVKIDAILASMSETVGAFVEEVLADMKWLYDNIIEPIITPLTQMFQDLWNNSLKNTLSNIGTFIKELVVNAMQIYNKFIVPVVSWLADYFKPIWATVTKFAIGVLGTFLEYVSDIVGAIVKVFRGIVDFIAGVFTGDWEKAWEGVSKILEGIFQGFISIIKVPLNLIIDLINGFIAGLNRIQIPDWVPSWMGGGKGLNIKYIPKLAQGGVVSSPTTALIGESGAEAVVPLENNTEWINKVAAQINAEGNNSQIIVMLDRIIDAINDKDFDVTIGDRDIYNANKRETNRQNRLLGRAY